MAIISVEVPDKIARKFKPYVIVSSYELQEEFNNMESNVEPLVWSEEVLWTKDHNDFISLLKSA